MKAMLGFDDMREVLGKYGFPMLEEGLAKTEDEAVKIANNIGFPVVLKSVPPENHRTNANTISNSAEEVRRRYLEILKNTSGDLDGVNILGVLVQRQAAHGMEAVVGMTRDPQLGPIVTFGLSGVFAFLKDISHGVAPISREEALKMIKEIEAYSIIKGDEKKRPCDIGAIADVIEKVSKLSMENDNILEIDINPLFVYEEGAVVIDARVVVG